MARELQYQGFRISLLERFLERLTGAITRPLSEWQGLLFSPGGSVHTCFMRQSLDVAFIDREGRVLRCDTAIPPWRCCLAPRQTCYTLELRAGGIVQLGLEPGDLLEINGVWDE